MQDHIFETMKKSFSFLEKSKDWEIDLINHAGILKKCTSGELLAGEGFLCNGVAFVVDGTVRVYTMSSDGREMTLYRIRMGESCVLTMLCFLGNTENSTFAIAEENASVIIIPQESFNKLFHTSPDWSAFVFRSLSDKVTELMLFVEEFAFHSMDKRLAIYLYEASLARHTNTILTTHEQIASELGTAREVVSRLLKTFEKNGMVVLSRGKIEVDARALAQFQLKA